MNEERPVERALRRFAKKRRTDIGSTSEMRPATRRLLQSEVARRFPPTISKGRSGLDVLVAFLTNRWVYGAGILLIMMAVAAVMMPSSNKSKHVGDLALNEQMSAAQIQEDALPTSSTASVRTAEGSKMPDRAEPRLAPAPPASSPAQILLVKGSVNQPSEEHLATKSKTSAVTSAAAAGGIVDQLARSQSATMDDRDANSPADEQRLARGGGGNIKIVSQTRQNFFRQSYANDFPVRRLDTTDITGKKPGATVLENFQVEQDGNTVRVIDGDGSTYFGVTETIRNDDARHAEKSFAENKRDQAKSIQNTNIDSFQFRVAGTNRTLNQPVVFTWNYLPPTNAAVTNSDSFVSGDIKTLNSTTTPQQFPGFQNLFLNGRAQIASEKEVEVNARPVPE